MRRARIAPTADATPSMKSAGKLSGQVAELLLASCVVALAGFIGLQTMAVRRAHTRTESAGAIGAVVDPTQPFPVPTRTAAGRTLATHADVPGVHGVPAGDIDAGQAVAGAVHADANGRLVGGAALSTTRLFADAGTVREMRRRISAGATGTYIGELLVARDSALSRWPDRLSRPLRVWVDDAPRVDGWREEFAPAVREAFESWSATGIPVRFDFIVDSSSADVHVRFTDRLPNGISGKTVWSRDAMWWLVSGDIQLALVHPSGGIVNEAQMRAIALHEVGHLLGLDHASASDNIMAARVRVRDLSEADRATARLLYSMPAGSIK
jgi:hypothetical protein